MVQSAEHGSYTLVADDERTSDLGMRGDSVSVIVQQLSCTTAYLFLASESVDSRPWRASDKAAHGIHSLRLAYELC